VRPPRVLSGVSERLVKNAKPVDQLMKQVRNDVPEFAKQQPRNQSAVVRVDMRFQGSERQDVTAEDV